jgi:hypothetical protein
MNWHTASLFTILVLCVGSAAGQLATKSFAQGSTLAGNLFRSRDALLTQKSELESASDRIDKQMAELARQQDRIQNYLRDTDRALKDIDIALRETH